jgi:glycosyltransferase involved in cell wall biosynthesis
VVPHFHAMIMETELVDEVTQIARMVELLDTGRIPAVSVSDPNYVNLLGRDGIVAFPDVIDEHEYSGVRPAHLMGVNVSLFGAADLRKNILTQAAAFKRALADVGASRWTLHLNGQTLQSQAYRLWLKTARIPFVDHGRLERNRYLSLVAAMDAGLCASLRESYGYVAADHVVLGVPIVASQAVACLNGGAEYPGPHDLDGIAHALSMAIADREGVNSAQRMRLREQARKNEARARAALAELRVRAQRT